MFVQSLDPNRTVAHQPADVPSSETLDVTRAKTTPPANADEPPDGLPVIPGYPITTRLAGGRPAAAGAQAVGFVVTRLAR